MKRCFVKIEIRPELLEFAKGLAAVKRIHYTQVLSDMLEIEATRLIAATHPEYELGNQVKQNERYEDDARKIDLSEVPRG